jgi:N-acetylglucosaminyldiphosphoundecaprenol N-acetyl-beta-D-mannosaminyltransferase
MSKDSWRTVALFGLPVSNVTMSAAVSKIAEWIESGTRHQIVTANLDFARNARKSEFLHRVICGCSMVLPDGAPLLWASRLLRRPLKERVTGVDLVVELAKLSDERGYGIFLLGSDEKNVEAAVRVMKDKYPNARFVGSYSPAIRPLEEMDNTEMLRRIEDANPDILLVAFGNPKQEVWISRNFHHLQVPVTIGIGGSLDMIAGSLKRAPKWIQNLHMEWCFRMIQEPRRLFPRYAHDLMALIRHLPAEIIANRMQPEQSCDRPLVVEGNVNDAIIRTPEILTGKECASLLAAVREAAQNGQTLILDLERTSRIEADGIGCLIEVRRIMMVAHREMWLTAISQPVQAVLKTSALSEMFRTAATPADALRLSKMGLPHPDRRQRRRVVSGALRSQASS